MNGTLLAGRYRLEVAIGHGGQGTVYRAADERTGGTVAVKLLDAEALNDATITDQLRREARLAATIVSPRVVRIIDVDVHDGLPFLVMEYVAGETLQQMLRRRGKLPIDEALSICVEVARALESADSVHIIHRDLKPQNIKLVEGQVKVLDFGLARLLDPLELAQTHGFRGTPQYSAPERAWERGDVRADIYSIGVILYRAVEGRLPFTAPDAAVLLFQHARTPVPAMSAEVPPAVRELILRCLAKEPDERYRTPAELVAALTAALASLRSEPAIPAMQPADGAANSLPAVAEPAIAGPPPHDELAAAGNEAPQAPHVRARRRSWRWPAAIGGAVLAVALVAVVVIAGRGGGNSGHGRSAVTGEATPAAPAALQRPVARNAAQASAGPTLGRLLAIDGAPLTVEVTVAAQPLLLGFDAAAGANLTLALTDVSGSGGYYLNVFVAAPNGSEIARGSFGDAGGPIHLAALPAAGRYVVALTLNGQAPAKASVGLAQDRGGTLQTDGSVVMISLEQPWQVGRLQFTGAMGQRLQLSASVTRTGRGDCCLQVLLIDPHGLTTLVSGSLSSQGASLMLGPLPATGTYILAFGPDAVETADVTVSLSAVP